MRSAALALLILYMVSLSTAISHQRYKPCTQSKIDHAHLALTWIGEFCTEIQCNPKWKSLWDNHSFKIHGYWPSSSAKGYLSCVNGPDGHDPFCYTKFKFNADLLAADKSLIKDLDQYWPEEIGRKPNFRNYQWEKHGTCYLNQTLKAYPSKWSKNEGFSLFFKQVVDKYKSFPALANIKSDKYTKKDFGTELGLPTNQFIVVCGKDDQLDELRICYGVGSPGSEKPINCPSFPKECPPTFYLKGWSK